MNLFKWHVSKGEHKTDATDRRALFFQSNFMIFWALFAILPSFVREEIHLLFNVAPLSQHNSPVDFGADAGGDDRMTAKNLHTKNLSPQNKWQLCVIYTQVRTASIESRVSVLNTKQSYFSM